MPKNKSESNSILKVCKKDVNKCVDVLSFSWEIKKHENINEGIIYGHPDKERKKKNEIYLFSAWDVKNKKELFNAFLSENNVFEKGNLIGIKKLL